MMNFHPLVAGRFFPRLLPQSRPAASVYAPEREYGAEPLYRRAAFRYISLVITALMAPCAIWNFIGGRYELALIETAVLLPLLWHCWQLLCYRRNFLTPVALLSLSLATLGLSFYYGQNTNVYWAPALVVTFHFMLERKLALIFNGLFFLVVTPVALEALAPSHAVMFLINLALVSVTVYIFSLMVFRQDQMLQKLAVQDPLTHAYNRRFMMESLDQTVELNKRYGKTSSLIMLDIDHFKRVNDELGHGEGDKALQAVVRLIQQRLRRTDLLFRYGGEEFVILLSETESVMAYQLAEEFCLLVRRAPILAGRPITVSCGVAEFSSGENPLGWLARCDEALYRAKHTGRDRAELA